MSIPANTYKAKVIEKKQLTHKIYELLLDLGGQHLDFKAGQCVGFKVNDKYKRLYSITSLPKQDRLDFLIDVSPDGPASKFVMAMQPGQQFEIEGPYGGFVVNDIDQDLLFVATGVGVAPFQSMIPDLLQRGFEKKITLIFGVRDEGDIFKFKFFQELADAHKNFEFIAMLSQPQGEWKGEVGRVTEHLKNNMRTYKNRQAYICGGAEMIKDTRSLLVSNGWEAKAIKLEIFV